MKVAELKPQHIAHGMPLLENRGIVLPMPATFDDQFEQDWKNALTPEQFIEEMAQRIKKW